MLDISPKPQTLMILPIYPPLRVGRCNVRVEGIAYQVAEQSLGCDSADSAEAGLLF